MAKYPGEIYEPREKENRSGVDYEPEKKSVAFVEDIKFLDDEVVAIETELIGAVTREHADNEAAKLAGLVDGQLYRTGDFLKIVHS